MRAVIGVALGLVLAMGCDGGGGGDVDSGAVPGADAGSVPGAGRTVTLGVYTMEGGTYTDTGNDLVIEVGLPCFTWSRTTRGHEAGQLPENLEMHLHYNAADDTSYADDTITWTEYGPEHTQEDIEATCAAGVGGVTKSVNSTEYYDHGMFFLRIVGVD